MQRPTQTAESHLNLDMKIQPLLKFLQLVYKDLSCRQKHGTVDEEAVIRFTGLPTAVATQFVAQM